MIEMPRKYLPSSEPAPEPEETPAETPVAPEPEPVTAPPKSASKPEWVAFVTEHKGVSQEDAEKATKDELIELYGD